MKNINIKQMGGFLFSFLLVISGMVLLVNGYDNEWGWLLGLGFISFIITLVPSEFLG